MGEKLIPKSVSFNKVKLTPKGFVQLAIAIAVVMGAIELGKWLYSKVKGTVEAKTSGMEGVI